jgi:hypothetical protein
MWQILVFVRSVLRGYLNAGGKLVALKSPTLHTHTVISHILKWVNEYKVKIDF